MKKHLLTGMMLIFIIFPLSAQKSKDVLYLKNGTRIYGKLMEISNDQYKIRTPEGNIFTFQGIDVEKYVNERATSDSLKKNGAGFALEGGVLAGAQSNKYDAAFSFNFIGSIKANKFDSFGLGSGVEYLGQPFLPIFLEYRHLMSVRKTTPFIFIRGGGLFHLNGDFERTDLTSPVYDTPMSYKGGFSLTIGTGISWFKDDYESYLTFAFRNAHTSYDELEYNNQRSTYKNSYNRLEIKYGFRF
jgi:hypothetical protein